MKFTNLKKITNMLILIMAITCLLPLSSRATNNFDNIEAVNKTSKTVQSFPRYSGIQVSDRLKDIYNTDPSVNSMGGKIIGVAQYICYGAAVIILLIKGVQFMQQAPEARAEIKKELINYVIGAFILFSIGTLIKIIGNIALDI